MRSLERGTFHRPLIDRCLHRSLSLIALFLLLVNQPLVANELDNGIRLFFPIKTALENKGDTVQDDENQLTSSETDAGLSNDNSATENTLYSVENRQSSPRIVQLWFSGVVRSGQRTLVLVNDLPCDVVKSSSGDSDSAYLEVFCKHLEKAHYLLKHRLGTQSLRVYASEDYVATLLVGQKL